VITRTAVQIPIPLDDVGHTGEGKETALLPSDTTRLLLIEYGVSPRKAQQLADKYDVDRVRENITYAQEEYESGKVRKLSAYVIRAIEEDYRPKKTPVDIQKEKEQADAEERRRRQEALEDEKRAWHRYRDTQVRRRFANLPADEQERRREKFVEQLRTKNPILYKRYKKEGFGSRLVDVEFFAGLSGDLLVDPEEVDIAAFRAGRRTEAG
jgi:hypothetical protein